MFPDDDAEYDEVITVDLSSLEPQVVLPNKVAHNVKPAREVAGQKVDQAFIGSCANGRLSDFAVAAEIVKGKQIASGTRFIVTPGSQSILKEAIKLGYVETLMDAGAVVTSSTCGACFGGHMGLLADGETCITASTRNFKGRMGSPDAQVFMGSPATVAASAITGVITDPRDSEDRRGPTAQRKGFMSMDDVFTGKVWKFGDDINTDLVIPNFAVLMTKEEQLEHVFSANRPGWKDEVQPGDVLLAGRNFGVGSARPIGDMFVRTRGERRRGRLVQRAGLAELHQRGAPVPSVPRASSTPSTRATWPRSTGSPAPSAMSPRAPRCRATRCPRCCGGHRGRRRRRGVLRTEGYLRSARTAGTSVTQENAESGTQNMQGRVR